MPQAKPRTTIRRAEVGDARRIADIYNAAGAHETPRAATAAAVTPQERAAWLAERRPRHPVFVLERSARAVAYAAINAPYWRPELRRVASTCVFVAPEAAATLAPAMCLAHVLLSAEALGYDQVVNPVLGCNPASLRGTGRVMERLGELRGAYPGPDGPTDIVFFRTTAAQIRAQRGLLTRVLRHVNLQGFADPEAKCPTATGAAPERPRTEPA